LSETMRNGGRLHWKPRSITDCSARGKGWRRKKRWKGRYVGGGGSGGGGGSSSSSSSVVVVLVVLVAAAAV